MMDAVKGKREGEKRGWGQRVFVDHGGVHAIVVTWNPCEGKINMLADAYKARRAP
jgi:hypothetical protein